MEQFENKCNKNSTFFENTHKNIENILRKE